MIVRDFFAIGRTILLIIAAVVGGNAFAEESPRLREILKPIIAAHQGEVAVSVKHLSQGATFSHRADEPMPTASLIKFPVMIAAYHEANSGRTALASQVVLRAEDKVPGSGILTSHFSDGATLSLRDAIRLMIAFSDNTATNLVIDQIGLSSTNDLMEKWGLNHTRLHAKVYRGDTSIAAERSKLFGLGSTTANEMIQLLERLHSRSLVSAEASQQMYDHLLSCDDRERLTRFLPTGTKVALKTGAVSASRTVAGIIESPSGPIAICVLTTKNKDQRWTDDNAAQLLSAEISRAVWQHFHPAPLPTGEDSPAELAQGASGELVEALQRTLNQRMTPSPQLNVDGDFGPATRQAVLVFQRSKKLAQTGTVNSETWASLGPLVLTAEEQAFDPETVNREVLPLQPPDALDGPPYVTADAWAIGSTSSGRLLWSDRGDDRREVASTTKTMTAWIVIREAERNPAVLDEIVTFSKEADRVTGTTAGIRAGEKLSVKDLLYGLLLPSGNDAAWALAEQLGKRFAESNPQPSERRKDGESSTASRASAVEQFVSEMNRTAKELGMTRTLYANPHGLPDTSHMSTANDQLKLSIRALKSELFRHYVETRQRGVRVDGPGGYTRNIVWKNSNKLLDIAGYRGIKTGTTDAAGACLVSVGKQSSKEPRSEVELVVVVLGSSSNEARYVDTRNLFRWAWQQHFAVPQKKELSD